MRQGLVVYLCLEGGPAFRKRREAFRLGKLKEGELQRLGIESTGSYGAGLLRFMQKVGVAVLEVTTPDKQDRRRRGAYGPIKERKTTLPGALPKDTPSSTPSGP